MEEQTKITIKKILLNIICLIVVVCIAWFILYTMAKPLKFCEEKGWDGSEYRKEHLLFKDTVAKCNKAPNETDAMIDVLDALPFIKIKSDTARIVRE